MIFMGAQVFGLGKKVLISKTWKKQENYGIRSFVYLFIILYVSFIAL